LLSGCGNSSTEKLETSTGTVKAETLSEPGPFVAGFQFIKYVDKTREVDTGGRPVPVFFFFPAEPKSVTAAPPLASYPRALADLRRVRATLRQSRTRRMAWRQAALVHSATTSRDALLS
jgi:hypothetical protein